MKRICLLDLNYTLVANQSATRLVRPFNARLSMEEYRLPLIDSVREDYVILITARPSYQGQETLANILHKTGWQPNEAYFNDLDLPPAQIKESILQRFVFPKHGENGSIYYAWESNPKTRAMYARYGIDAHPYKDEQRPPLSSASASNLCDVPDR